MSDAFKKLIEFLYKVIVNIERRNQMISLINMLTFGLIFISVLHITAM